MFVRRLIGRVRSRLLAGFPERLEARVTRLDSRVDELFELCSQQNHLVHEIHDLLARGAVDRLDDSLNALAVAHAESVVYLHRALIKLGEPSQGDTSP